MWLLKIIDILSEKNEFLLYIVGRQNVLFSSKNSLFFRLTNAICTCIITNASQKDVKLNNENNRFQDQEKYSRGWRGAPAKGVGRSRGARVQIPLSPFRFGVIRTETVQNVEQKRNLKKFQKSGWQTFESVVIYKSCRKEHNKATAKNLDNWTMTQPWKFLKVKFKELTFKTVKRDE